MPILVVDDDPLAGEMTAALLEHQAMRRCWPLTRWKPLSS